MNPVPFQMSYKANNSWGSCTSAQVIKGYEPDEPGTYPVFVYVHATIAQFSDSWKVTCERAAMMGFVACAPIYEASAFTAASLPQMKMHARCMFDTAYNPNSAMGAVYSRPKADPNKGVVVLGFSQGAAVAGFAALYEPRVKANLLYGFSGGATLKEANPPSRGGTRPLPDSAIRVHNGQGEQADVPSLLASLGNPPQHPDDPLDYTRSDMSGLYIVPNDTVEDVIADHCWMSVGGCTGHADEPTYGPGNLHPWSLDMGLYWLSLFCTP